MHFKARERQEQIRFLDWHFIFTEKVSKGSNVFVAAFASIQLLTN